jgi:glutaminyl-peptide cyclotransferase
MARRGWLAPLLAVAIAGTGACGASQPAAVSGERALARVRHQLEAGPRIPGTAGHAAVREWIASEITRLGGQVERQSFTDSSLATPLALTNMIGHFGTHAAPGVRRVVLAAHYDTRPWSDQDPDSAHRSDPVPGANDGASGVAVLLEVAECLAGQRPGIAVDLVFLDGEDQGRAEHGEEFCLGARGYARRLPDPPPSAAFVFDMVGDRDLAIHPEQRSAREAANLNALVLEGARATGAAGFHEAPRYYLTDDHVPLLDARVPAVDIIDFDYPAWHTHRDDLDQVSAGSLAQVARVAAWLVTRSPLARPR